MTSLIENRELKKELLISHIGEFIDLVGPNTESDPLSLLVHFFVFFGNMVGRSAHMLIDGSKHFANFNAIIVGQSAKGRKGTALGHVRNLFENVDQLWFENCQNSGLSSGEGMIASIAKRPHEEHLGRQLFIESEFGSVLHMFKRVGNTLSPVLRDAWDHGNLNTCTKEPMRAKNAHISVIGHITEEELKSLLSSTEIFNGLANRFAWFRVKRVNLLPLGGNIDQHKLVSLKLKIKESVEWSKKQKQLFFSKEAESYYVKIYSELSVEQPGIVGSICSRAEPIIIRFALNYALLEKCSLIELRHISAAHELWKYAQDSVEYIFSSKQNTIYEKKLMETLDTISEMSLTELHAKVFGNNHDKDTIRELLFDMEERGLIKTAYQDGKGRPKMIITRTCELTN